MKASELITKLQEAKKRYGNLPVTTTDWPYGRVEVSGVHVYTESGNYPDGRKKRTNPPIEINLL